MPTFQGASADISADLARMSVNTGSIAAADAIAKRIIAKRGRFEVVEAATGVPWFFIGVLMYRESDLAMTTHLHNGDSLKRRTVHVPAGRPLHPEPPYSWEESAIDALRYDGLVNVADWTETRMAYEAEKYNGFGPRNRGRKSGYVWAGSNIYTGGKYVADGVWSASTYDQQIGCMTVLRRLCASDALITARVMAGGVATRPITKADVKAALPLPPTTVKTTVAAVGAVASVAATGSNWPIMWPILTGVLVVAAIVGEILWVRYKHARLAAVVASPSPEIKP